MPAPDTPKIAPDGHVYLCGACGKRSRDIYGDQAIDYGWDESCFLNSVIVSVEEAEQLRARMGKAPKLAPSFP